MPRRYILIIVLLTIGFAGGTALGGSVVGSDHDLTSLGSPKLSRQHVGVFYNDYSEICIYCHTPHGADPAVPLWNRDINQSDYTLYDSTTLTANMEQPPIGGTTRMCLSCHDGTIAVDRLLNYPNKPYAVTQQYMYMEKDHSPHGGTCGYCHMWFYETPPYPNVKPSFMTPDLSDDHPVSFIYNETLANDDGGLESPSAPSGMGGTIAQDMLLNGDRVECPSCHDVHDPDIFPFLIKSNDNSELCYTCHIK